MKAKVGFQPKPFANLLTHQQAAARAPFGAAQPRAARAGYCRLDENSYLGARVIVR